MIEEVLASLVRELVEPKDVLTAEAGALHHAIGEKLGAYQGLDGIFDAIWTDLEAYPEWTMLVLDEIDDIKQDSNYDPNDFFYRLQRRRSTPGRPKQRGAN